MVRVTLGHLQDRKEILGAVVGGQRLVQERGKPQALFPKRLDDMGLFHGGIKGLRIQSSPAA